MDLYLLNNDKFEEIKGSPFQLEKDVQKLIEQNTEVLFNLEFVCSEFPIEQFRLDTLCFDGDTKSFVIIEYKKGRSESVIDQGYSYLSTMLNHKADFILEYNEKKNINLKRDEVDWQSSRIIFISQEFSQYQKNSINFKDIPFELWEIKRFVNNHISLNQIQTNSNQSIKQIKQVEEISLVDNDVISPHSEEEHIQRSSKKIKEIYAELKSRLQEYESTSFNPTKYYINFKRRQKVVCYIFLRTNTIQINIIAGFLNSDGSKKPGYFFIEDPKSISVEKVTNRQNGIKDFEYQFNLSEVDDIDYIEFLIKQKYKTLL
jgi:hypothetical protein